MATIVVVVQSTLRARRDARVLAAEVAGALSNLGLSVTLSDGMEWPAHDSNGRDAVVARHELLALAAAGHEIIVEVAR